MSDFFILFQSGCDNKNRLLEQKAPGSGWVYNIYDNRGRLVMSQDAIQRTSNEWTFTKYDRFDRPVLTGYLPLALL